MRKGTLSGVRLDREGGPPVQEGNMQGRCNVVLCFLIFIVYISFVGIVPRINNCHLVSHTFNEHDTLALAIVNVVIQMF